MRKVVFIIVSLFFLSAVGARADFDINAWKSRARITGGQSSSEYAILQMPSEFFSHLKPDLSDLRIVNRDGEVPYVLGVEKETVSSSKVPARMYNLSSGANGTAFIADLGPNGSFHNAITIQVTSENFRRGVTIEGSQDEKSWRTLISQGQIFDYTVRDIKSVSVRDTDVSYPEATFRYLRVTISGGSLDVRGAQVFREIQLAAREAAYEPVISVSENSEARTTDAVLDMATDGIPHRRGTLKTASVNFNRPIAIYDSSNKSDWRLLTYGYLYRVETSLFTGSNLEFVYPESNRRYLKISVLNGDDRPISIDGVSLYGVVRRVIFSYDPAKEYFAYLGRPDARRPQYDFEKISQYLDVSSLDQVSAGPIEANSSYVEPE
ncbi:MAG: DUF3999 family protein, partial [Patescibacteria group bacterium]